MAGDRVLISEVGPRDGLQMVAGVMPTTVKHAWIAAEAAAGVREIEVCSFVPPKLVPGMADAAEVTRQARTIADLTVAVLVPNRRGAADALAAGAMKLTVPVSVSRSHSMANVRKTPEAMVEEIAGIAELIAAGPDPRPILEAGLSTAFGCSLEGAVPEADVLALAEACLRAGADEIGLADTAGMGNPAQVRRLFPALARAIGADRVAGAHFHNTRGQGLANVVAALDADIRTFDSSMGGLGGCPFAPGATGNIVTEDLVWMLAAMGLETGIDLDRLIAVRKIVAGGLPGEPLYGHVAEAGSGSVAPVEDAARRVAAAG